MIGFIFDSMWSRAKVHEYNKQDGQYLNRASIPIFLVSWWKAIVSFGFSVSLVVFGR